MSATFNKRGRRPARAPRAASLVAVFLVALAALGSCGQPDPVDETVYPVSASFDAADESAWTAAGPSVRFRTHAPDDRNEEVSFTASGLVAGQAFLVVTNADPGASFALSGTLANAAPEARTALDASATADSAARYLRDIPAVSAFNADPWAFVSKEATSRSIVPAAPLASATPLLGTSNIFSIIVGDVSAIPPTYTEVAATCHWEIEDSGGRVVRIWVQDTEWETSGAKVTQTMVDAMGERFFKPDTTGDDILDWVSGIFGDDYNPGSVPPYGMIADTDALDILVADIADQKIDNGGIVGYFHSLHNYSATVAGAENSNERIMFFVDAPMFANSSNNGGDNDRTWSATDYWPEQVWSTLAHELQHMIHFNEKIVERGVSTSSTWFNEMCSAAAEDFVSRRLAVDGPRGVPYDDGTDGGLVTSDGRLPYFVAQPANTLTVWTGSNEDYATVYAFAAWLGRNYGAGSFSSMVQGNLDGFDAVLASTPEAATGEALRNWAIAALSSSRQDMSPSWEFNGSGTGWFPSDTDENRLGSIELANYQWPGASVTGLVPATSIPAGSIAPAANLYIELPVVDGTASGTLTLYRGMSMTVVVTD
ncbi:MAG: hypothetical protein KBC36_06975 [Spirochaetia bacterium]|nr:hypothetical protein [Spirochaetia bacterium]